MKVSFIHGTLYGIWIYFLISQFIRAITEKHIIAIYAGTLLIMITSFFTGMGYALYLEQKSKGKRGGINDGLIKGG